MKDFFGQTLQLGDEVGVLLKGYRHLVTATIIQFTPKMIRVEYQLKGNPWSNTYLVSSNMLVKKPRMIRLQTGEVREYEC